MLLTEIVNFSKSYKDVISTAIEDQDEWCKIDNYDTKPSKSSLKSDIEDKLTKYLESNFKDEEYMSIIKTDNDKIINGIIDSLLEQL